jgi:hypothetical protein
LAPFPCSIRNRHPVGVDVRHFEGDGLADTQAGGVDGGQQQPMAWMRRRGEQPAHLFPAQDLRQLLGLLGGGHVEVGARVAQRDVVEEAEGVRGLTARAPGQLALLNQVREVRLDLLVRELIR